MQVLLSVTIVKCWAERSELSRCKPKTTFRWIHAELQRAAVREKAEVAAEAEADLSRWQHRAVSLYSARIDVHVMMFWCYLTGRRRAGWWVAGRPASTSYTRRPAGQRCRESSCWHHCSHRYYHTSFFSVHDAYHTTIVDVCCTLAAITWYQTIVIQSNKAVGLSFF